jgi:hypothetical protein
MDGLNNILASVAARRQARVLWLALAMAACGGGVDSGGTGVAPQSYANGPITGFGSVIVNGVRFDDSSASVTDADGTACGRDSLRLGMTTEIRGSAITTDAGGASVSTASSITYGSDILGRIDSMDLSADNKHLVVLGQRVDINTTTVFDDVSVAGGLPALRAGDVVEVYALFDASTSRYSATRIERKGAVTAFRLRGVVRQVDAVNKLFNIGSQRISYAGFSGAAPVTPVDGNFLRVRLQTTQVGGVWIVAGLVDGAPKPKDMDEVRLEGVIGSFTSTTLFSVNGVPVNAGGITPPAGLAAGVRVEVEGRFSGGVLQADKLKIESPDDVSNEEFELRGLITSVDAPNLSFVLRGLTVTYSVVAPVTDFRDGTASDLKPGVNVEARGVLSADGLRLLAGRITFK